MKLLRSLPALKQRFRWKYGTKLDSVNPYLLAFMTLIRLASWKSSESKLQENHQLDVYGIKNHPFFIISFCQILGYLKGIKCYKSMSKIRKWSTPVVPSLESNTVHFSLESEPGSNQHNNLPKYVSLTCPNGYILCQIYAQQLARFYEKKKFKDNCVPYEFPPKRNAGDLCWSVRI